MKRLRTYGFMRRVSDKAEAENTSVATQTEVEHVRERSGGRCEVDLDGDRCPRRASEQHHVVKRSQGGRTHRDNLLAVCRPCHDRTDWPFPRGRLVILALGDERFACAVRYAKDRFAARSEATDA